MSATNGGLSRRGVSPTRAYGGRGTVELVVDVIGEHSELLGVQRAAFTRRLVSLGATRSLVRSEGFAR
jgi:hypothetical protein